jgi:hypothetical protein
MKMDADFPSDTSVPAYAAVSCRIQVDSILR